jgi:predicted transcriptional regulator
MDYKRLNNITGKDAVLNRRITSIFINELENNKKLLKDLDMKNLQELEFAIHKIRPSLVIFEMEYLMKSYEMIISYKKGSDHVEEISEIIERLMTDIDASIERLRQFILGIA